MGKKIEGGKKTVSQKKKNIQKKKWLIQIYCKFDEIDEQIKQIKERLDLIEKFLGGVKSMKKILKNKATVEEFWKWWESEKKKK